MQELPQKIKRILVIDSTPFQARAISGEFSRDGEHGESDTSKLVFVADVFDASACPDPRALDDGRDMADLSLGLRGDGSCWGKGRREGGGGAVEGEKVKTFEAFLSLLRSAVPTFQPDLIYFVPESRL